MKSDDRKLLTDDEIQVILDNMAAEKIAAYIIRRNKNHPTWLTTLREVCKKFKISQQEAKRIIASSEFLFLSDFAYQCCNNVSLGVGLFYTMIPIYLPDVADGRKLVQVFDDKLPAKEKG